MCHVYLEVSGEGDENEFAGKDGDGNSVDFEYHGKGGCDEDELFQDHDVHDERQHSEEDDNLMKLIRMIGSTLLCADRGAGSSSKAFRVEAAAYGIWGAWIWSSLYKPCLVISLVHKSMLQHLRH